MINNFCKDHISLEWLIQEFFSDLAFKLVQVLLFGFLCDVRSQVVLHLVDLVSDVLLQFSQFLLRQLLKVELVLLAVVIKGDTSDSLDVLLGQSLNVEG